MGGVGGGILLDGSFLCVGRGIFSVGGVRGNCLWVRGGRWRYISVVGGRCIFFMGGWGWIKIYFG